jgi:hypothetical protein
MPMLEDAVGATERTGAASAERGESGFREKRENGINRVQRERVKLYCSCND